LILHKFFLSNPSDLLDDDMTKTGIISHRHLTGINEYPVLGFLQEQFPYKLLDILRIESTPLIYQNSVLESVERFAVETGNSNLINSSYHDMSGVNISFASNQGGRTVSGSFYRGSGRRDHLQVFNQSQIDYENNTLAFNQERQSFFYAPVRLPFKTDLQDAQWTCLCRDLNSNTIRGEIYQYPELGRLLEEKIRDFNCPEVFNDKWIVEIARQNPDCRGFLLYQYGFISDASEYFRVCGYPDVHRYAPSSYLRFVHIKNESAASIHLESLQIRFLQNHPYQLTDVTYRSEILKKGRIIDQDLNIMLLPGQDLLIPIEFGFDTKSQLKHTSHLDNDHPSTWLSNEMQLLVVKPLLRETLIKLNSSLRNSESYEYYSDWVSLSQEYIRETKSLPDLKSICHKCFAVGDFMDVKMLRFDGKELSISSPNDNPKISISTYFAYGSCPYLLVFDAQKNFWIEKGVILLGRQSQQMEGEDIYSIEKEISKIKIEERDHEITFLKSLKLIYTDSQSNEQGELELLTSNMLEENRGYYILNEDNFLELDIDEVLPESAENITLNVVGYYEIL
jgi:hypothetical protein